MSCEIKSEYVDLAGQSVLLVSVKNSTPIVGVCSAGRSTERANGASINKIFYMGNNPVINILCPNNGDKRSDKLMALCNPMSGDTELHKLLTEALTKLNRGDSAPAALGPFLCTLPDGVYTLYTSEYYPTDGNGNFFWGAYNIAHEIHGSAEHNRTFGKDKLYRPCFLLPSLDLNNFLPKIKSTTDIASKSRRVQGIALHLSGLYSILLKGHHGAVSCTEAGLPFTCLVIERVTEPYTVPLAPPVTAPVAPDAEPQLDENGNSIEEPVQPKPVTNEDNKRVGITGFRSASVKIPLEVFPKDMLKLIINNRVESKPKSYEVLIKKMNQVRRKALSNNALPHHILEKCERMPDCEMVESSYAVEGLSEEQLQALLNGETVYNEQVIISTNFYTSIVTACNFLQFHDLKRFIQFSLAIMDNPELSATHEYISRRVSHIDSKTIYEFFKGVVISEDAKYTRIADTALRYVKAYEAKHQ